MNKVVYAKVKDSFYINLYNYSFIREDKYFECVFQNITSEDIRRYSATFLLSNSTVKLYVLQNDLLFKTDENIKDLISIL